MIQGPCQLADCTFNMTGSCVQNNPVETCPNRSTAVGEGDYPEGVGARKAARATDASIEGLSGPVLGSAVLDSPRQAPNLPPSLTMGLEDASSLMTRRQTTVVGILGLPNSGKTACLVSAYLLLAKGTFEGYDFANSGTLMAFEQIARGSRQWAEGNEPGTLTTHTEMADDRQAGFLHLRLRRLADGKLYDVLLPDLPGEWSKALIDKADSERFAFLRSATVIWLMVDGRAFSENKTKRYATYRTELLVERLAGIIPTPRPRVILVPTWKDHGEFPADAYESIRRTGVNHGIDIAIAPIASFSFGEIAPGYGIAPLLDTSLNHTRTAPLFWPNEYRPGERTLTCFRGTE